jgi:hypothetical protein
MSIFISFILRYNYVDLDCMCDHLHGRTLLSEFLNNAQFHYFWGKGLQNVN